MSTNVIQKEFDWAAELEKTVIKSLTTSFGLDFLLFNDKLGGNVDTIHNARNSVYATKIEENRYLQKEKYNSDLYHQDPNYKARGKSDKAKHQQGTLTDTYRNSTLKQNEKRQLDHVISAHEIEQDAGRILAELDGVKLANQDSNLSSTLAYINTKKSDKSVEEFVASIPAAIQEKQNSLEKNKAKLAFLPNNTPEEQDNRRKLEDKIRNEQSHIDALQSVNKDTMLAADKKARSAYNSQVNWNYYTSSKFFKNSSSEAGKAGLSMGLRQALGLVLAELWFELKEAIPRIYQSVKTNFTLDNFVSHIKNTLKNIWERIQLRFNNLLLSFKDGVIGGILGSLTSTLWNAFQTIGGNIIKLIRETWSSLVQAAKLIFFNPDKLALGDLMKELSKIIGLAVATSLGTILNQYLSTLLTFPFGDSLAAFLSALVVGLMTLGMSYFLDHSELMQKVWNYLNNLKNRYDNVLENLKEINKSLDDYLINLSKTELNLNPEELRRFTDSLYNTNSELERSVLLHEEVKRRNIALPFDSGNLSSTRDWLKKL
jgi:ATPase involved in DNA repair, putative transmembrane protein